MSFEKGGQTAVYHTCPHAYGGFFHTYDQFKVGDHTPTKIHIFLPSEYEERQDISYPVIYFLDGNTTFWPGGLANKCWKAGETLSNLYSSGSLRTKLIVVAIYPQDRNYQYTHQYWLPGFSHGGVSEYGAYLAIIVKGWIDVHYRTQSSRENTAIIGSSHGGLAAFHIAMSNPIAFGIAVCMSSSFWAGHVFDPSQLVGGLKKSKLISDCANTLENREQRPRLWIDWGMKRDGGFHNYLIERYATVKSQEMADLLVRKYGYVEGVDLHTHVDEIGGHDEDAWAYRFGLVVNTYFK